MDNTLWDELDRKILQLLANDAKISFLEVSRICNVSGAAVHQRVQKMAANGIIIGSEFRFNMPAVGYRTCVFASLSFDPTADADQITARLEGIPEIVECHVVIGASDFLVKIYARDNDHLLDIIHKQIKPLGIQNVESVISCREAFHRQLSSFGTGEK